MLQIKMVESLRDYQNEDITVDCVADIVQAVVQGGRCMAHPAILSKVHDALTTALTKVAGETVLDAASQEGQLFSSYSQFHIPFLYCN